MRETFPKPNIMHVYSHMARILSQKLGQNIEHLKPQMIQLHHVGMDLHLRTWTKQILNSLGVKYLTYYSWDITFLTFEYLSQHVFVIGTQTSIVEIKAFMEKIKFGHL